MDLFVDNVFDALTAHCACSRPIIERFILWLFIVTILVIDGCRFSSSFGHLARFDPDMERREPGQYKLVESATEQKSVVRRQDRRLLARKRVRHNPKHVAGGHP